MKNQPDDDMRAEAQEYVDSLPDETAEGRLVTDAGAPADEDAWSAERAKQQAALAKKKGNQK
jgi:hypothetical protein